MNYFFPRQKLVGESGQRVSIPQEPVEVQPLNKEVDFVDRPESKSVQTTEVVTAHGRLLFSTEAASLQKLEFIRNVDGKTIFLTTLIPPTDVEREKNFFLVAVNEKTPYFYTLENHHEDDRTATLMYRAHSSKATIEKTYTVYKDTYKVDLALTIKPHGSVQPRIFFAGPALSGLAKSEQVAGVMEEGSSIVKYLGSRYVRELNDNFWQRPTLFGAEDRYFINAVVADTNNFTQRGYYKVEGEKLYPILEGPKIEKETSWKLSFYLGPKEQAAMAVVDPRLDTVLDFGWFSPIAKLLLWLLLWLNSYVHNFGWAIILVTIVIRILLIPFSLSGIRQGKKGSEMQKKLQYIKQKYKDNPEQLAKEQEEFFKTHGFGAMGMGCLPMLLQFPVFIAMNKVLSSSIDLYQASFLWIPDLSTKDPYYILPVLVGISLYYFSVSQATDAQQRVSAIVMAVLMGGFSLGFSSGSSLYLIISSATGAAQTYILKKLLA